MLMLWSRDLPVHCKSLRNLPMKPPHPQTRRPHAQITLSTSLYWRTRDSRKYSERAIQHLVSEVHKIEGGGPSSDHEQAAPTDWRRTNEDSQRGLQRRHRAPARSSDVFPNQLQGFHMPPGPPRHSGI